jgi:hypothetical protein
MINSYTFGRFVVDGRPYETNIVLLGEDIKIARYLPNHELTLNDISPLIEFNPEYIIIGTGANGVMPVTKETEDFIKENRIKLIVEKTDDACRTYNLLISENKKVAAFLHNTC